MITFYDIPVSIPIKTVSLNTWKARYCLNYKGVPHQTKWLEYHEIEPLFKEVGIPPTTTNPDGTPFYTLPAIYDDETGAKISDSMNIAEYIDKTYPSGKPKIIPPGTEVLHRAFHDAFMETLTPIFPSYIPYIPDKLSPVSREHFLLTRTHSFGVKDLNDLLPKDEEARSLSFKKMEDSLGKVDGWLKPTGDKPFIGGNQPIFADFIIGSAMLSFMYVWGRDSVEWKAMSSWHGGRWGKIVGNLRKYETVN
ncbi:hypothetical protein BDQ17DRAFT_1332429 [Cyathus striatus]|nr:hypothetical protein BDQ17DRAFT_1332429 [Cyathus striatus]